MTKEFIPYEQALALKELGFEYIATIFAYDDAKELYTRSGIPHDFNIRGLLSAPLYQQAFRWFREKYDLFFNIYSSDPARTDVYWNIFIFGKTKNRQDVKLEYVSMIYEETELECLKKLIEIVKEKK
jgi:hypothetical protein